MIARGVQVAVGRPAAAPRRRRTCFTHAAACFIAPAIYPEAASDRLGPRRLPSAELAAPVPALVGVAREQHEARHLEAGDEPGQPVVGGVEGGVVDVVGDRHVRVVREVEIALERAAADRRLELLAVADAARDLDEHHRRQSGGTCPSRPGASGTAAACSATSARCFSMSGRSPRSTAVGGSSVTCGNTRSAAGSPTRRRQRRQHVACGCGIAIATPTTRLVTGRSPVARLPAGQPAGGRKPTAA